MQVSEQARSTYPLESVVRSTVRIENESKWARALTNQEEYKVQIKKKNCASEGHLLTEELKVGKIRT